MEKIMLISSESDITYKVFDKDDVEGIVEFTESACSNSEKITILKITETEITEKQRG